MTRADIVKDLKEDELDRVDSVNGGDKSETTNLVKTQEQ